MTNEEREDAGTMHPDAPEAEDVGEELMEAAFDAGLDADDDAGLDPEAQYEDEAVRVGRHAGSEKDEDEAEAGQRLSSLAGVLMYV